MVNVPSNSELKQSLRFPITSYRWSNNIILYIIRIICEFDARLYYCEVYIYMYPMAGPDLGGKGGDLSPGVQLSEA